MDGIWCRSPSPISSCATTRPINSSPRAANVRTVSRGSSDARFARTAITIPARRSVFHGRRSVASRRGHLPSAGVLPDVLLRQFHQADRRPKASAARSPCATTATRRSLLTARPFARWQDARGPNDSGSRPMPLKAAGKIKFERTAPEQRFDFVFNEISKDPAPVRTGRDDDRRHRRHSQAPASRRQRSPARTPASATTAAKPAADAPKPASPPAAAVPQAPLILDSPLAGATGSGEALDESRLPSAMPDLLAELTRRARRVEDARERGQPVSGLAAGDRHQDGRPRRSTRDRARCPSGSASRSPPPSSVSSPQRGSWTRMGTWATDRKSTTPMSGSRRDWRI